MANENANQVASKAMSEILGLLIGLDYMVVSYNPHSFACRIKRPQLGGGAGKIDH